ncbi:MAG: PD-(D/E)XK nuclease domain-containing protein [Ignavibacteriales bacterium]|nr:PD-(D/E)XK nuclease domain-containing protein [Ignavibacteriales bacterium]
MVKNVFNQFVKIFGEKNVSGEQQTSYGASIDLVLKQDNDYIFYEFKTSGSLREIIRDALSQLIEYSYYPSNKNAKN